MRYALIGDGESPHLLKWARALRSQVDLWVASSRDFLPELAALVPPEQRLALRADVSQGGGNAGLLLKLPVLARFLQRSDADWVNPHYLTSHGTLACAAKAGWRLRGRLVGSAWGSDILVTPQRHAVYRWITRAVLRSCALTTSDSEFMATRMRALGAREVMTFPFGLDRLPPPSPGKQPWLFYANRGLEPLYRPQRVLEVFADIARGHAEARLVVANDGSLRPALEEWTRQHGLGERVAFVGRLGPAEQDRWYSLAQWYISLPESDSISVSVLEAMGHGCVPLLSALPANAELVEHGRNGWIVPHGESVLGDTLDHLLARAGSIALDNRAWVQKHALFEPSVRRLLERLKEIDTAA